MSGRAQARALGIVYVLEQHGSSVEQIMGKVGHGCHLLFSMGRPMRVGRRQLRPHCLQERRWATEETVIRQET